MPLIDVPDTSEFRPVYQEPPPPPPTPSWSETFDAYMHLENDVTNAIEFLSRPSFKRDPEFDLGAELKQKNLWERRQQYLDVGSTQELDYRTSKLAQEDHYRDVASRAGTFGGLLAGGYAGLISPTMFLPIVGEARGARAFLTSASLAAMAGTAQEAVLQMNQEERTVGEGVASIGMQTILGMVLGGTIKNLTPREIEAVSRSMGDPETEKAISPPGLNHTDPTPDVAPSHPVTKTNEEGLTWYEVPSRPVEAPQPERAKLSIDTGKYRGPKIPAIRVGGEIFTGTTHAEALEKAVKQFGPDSPEIHAFDNQADALANIGMLDKKRGFRPGISGDDAQGISAKARELQPEPKPMTPPGQVSIKQESNVARIITSDASGDISTAIYREIIDDAFDSAKTVETTGRISKEMYDTFKALYDQGYDVRINPKAMVDGTDVVSPDARVPVVRVVDGTNYEVKAQVAAEPPRAQAAGAAVSEEDAGGIAVTPGVLSKLNLLSNQLARLSAPQRTLLQDTFKTKRNMMGKMSNFGLKREYEKLGLMGQEGGLVEDRAKAYSYQKYQAINKVSETYQKYRFGKATRGPAFYGNIKSALGGLVGDKMSVSEFSTAISRAIDRDAGKSDIPEVAEAAQYIMKTVYDPVFEEALRYGVLDKESIRALKNSKAYLNHIFKPDTVNAYPAQFIETLKNHILRNLQADFRKKWDSFVAKQALDEEAIADASLAAEDAIKLRDKFIEDLKADNLKPTALEDELAEARSKARDKKLSPDERKKAREDVKAIKDRGGEPLQRTQAERTALRRRIANLNKHAAVLGDKQAAKLESINRLEDRNLAALERVSRKSQKVLNGLDAFTDREVRAQLRDLRNDFAVVERQYDKMEERIVKDAGGTSEDVLKGQQDRGSKLTEITNAMQRVEDINPELARLLIKEANTDILDKVSRINNRRGMQMQKLSEQVKALDPKQAAAWIDTLKNRMKVRKSTFRDSELLSKATDPDLDAGRVSFASYATDAATYIKESIGKNPGRLSFTTISQSARGPELARHLDLPFDEISFYLETDIEKLASAYLRTLGPDIELSRAFGTYKLDEMPEWINAQNEYLALDAAIDTKLDSKGKPLSEKAKVKEHQKLLKMHELTNKAIEGTVARIRHTWGLPTDPKSMAYRMASVVSDINVGRFMGGVSIASIPDPARVVMKHALTTTFKVAFDAYTSGLKSLKISAQDARMSGAALDAVLHSRAYAMVDVMEDVGHTSKFERGIHYLSNKMGAIALFDYWTAEGKKFASAARNVELMENIDRFLHGGGKQEKATEFLANANLSADLAERVWAEIENGGGLKVNGRWYPEVEKWKDKDVARAYLAALVNDIDSTIVTPGLERPLWTNKTVPGRLLSQFKSFSMASNSKTIMAGLQQRDAAVLTGISISLALGALSDYLWAVSTGGQAYTRWENASIGERADRAIARSGLRGSFDSLGEILEKVPVPDFIASDMNMAQLAGLRFTNTRAGRTTGDSLLGAALGPSYDLLEKASAIAVAGGPTTKSAAHKLRQVLFFQNVFYIRQGLDAIEKWAAKDLPGKAPK